MTGQPTASSDALGAAVYIDRAATLRGVAAVETGESVGLGREVVLADPPGATSRLPPGEYYAIENGRFTFAGESLTLDCHGIANTHIDGLNHFGVDGRFHAAVPDRASGRQDGVAAWSGAGLLTRAVLADITALRGAPWVDTGEPVTAEELDRCLEAAGVVPLKGDALLLYMGRDRYEASGRTYPGLTPEAPHRPGAAGDVGDWLAEHRISVLCWDFLDASSTSPDATVHARIVTDGVILVDNCATERAVALLRGKIRPEGMFCLAPPALRGATGFLANPLLVS